MFLLAHIDFTLPLEDPILKFLLILVIILERQCEIYVCEQKHRVAFLSNIQR